MEVAVQPQPSRPTTRYILGVAVLLALMLPVTWVLRGWQVDRVAADVQEHQAEAVTDALADIEAQFRRMQADMLAQARAVAQSPVVMRGLRQRMRTGVNIGPEALVDFFAELEPGERTSIELYDVTPRLVAWHGFSMPLDAAPRSPRFLETYQTAITQDAGLRRALVIWWPVREGSRALGVVRVMRLIGFDAPVQNQYLRDFSLADSWRRATHLPVRVDFTPPFRDEAAGRAQARLLQGLDGTVLGRVVVEPPPPDQLVAAVRERFDHVLAFWATLLLSWLMAAVWRWYRNAGRAAAGSSSRDVLRRAALRFGVAALAWWGLRYALLLLDIPTRWQRGKAPLAPLFDPTHLASSLGGGLMRSVGDLLITALFAAVFAIAFIDLAAHFRDRGAGLYRLRQRWQRGATVPRSALRFRLVWLLAIVLVLGLVLLLSIVTRHVVLDSTFDFFARKGLLPDPLVLVVFCALLLAAVAVVVLSVGLLWMAIWWMLRYGPPGMAYRSWLEPLVGIALILAVAYGFFDVQQYAPWGIVVVFLTVGIGLAVLGLVRHDSGLELLALRSILPATFMVTVLLYPILYKGMETQQRIQMQDASQVFSDGRDPRVLFAIEQVLESVRDDEDVRAVLEPSAGAAARDRRLDSLAMSTLRGSLLASLAAYDVSLTIFDTDGAPLGRYYETGQAPDRSALDQVDALEFDILRQMYTESGSTGAMVEQVTGRRAPDRFQYEGIVPIEGPDGAVMGWVMARAEPYSPLREEGTPFPRVLLPAGSYDELYANLSVAEFRNGVLVRSLGRDFGRYLLSEEVQEALTTRAELWRAEQVEERTFLTYYRRQDPRPSAGMPLSLMPASFPSVLAVRVPAIHTFDHLFFLLRLTVAGLLMALPLYVVGVYLRWRAGLLPAARVRFRDKVLNAFLSVGIVTVTTVGFVGLRVVTGENDRAIQSLLRRHLEQVEETLALDTRGDEMPYRVLERTRIDSLAARVALDLNVFQEERLMTLSRPQLARERLIDRRLPIEAYRAIYFEGYRFTYTEEEVGSFRYTAGFQALPDEQGHPRYILSVPTLPEQERIEEERARTVAYLFGALLLLVLVVMLTASLLANAIARPIARLRSGLKAVAQGRFERVLPVDSRDEIGELVQTFNEMQAQLAESRRKLAQQERQLAWREMARQVAHEIKNPLTPMKLSVQHLRRAYASDSHYPERRERFDGLFERITGTLIEQIDTLARIANEFHSFARMPSRILERLDVNTVVEEAVALMQEESDVELVVDLCRKPLVVEADREELRRIFINLIKNAIQAIPEDRTGRIEVATALDVRAEGPYARATVADNGTGVPEELRGKIFEPNFSTKTSGTGLGLAIVRKGVEEMRGEIDFETEEGTGTTFWIRLPLVEWSQNGEPEA